MTLPSISGYTISRALGSGGFASVYLATKDETSEQVAIKVLHAHSNEASDQRRFERERTTMRAFNGHPNIVGVFDNGETENGEQYMVLEYVEGGTIRDRLRSQGALHWTDVLTISVQLCSALDVAHRSGVLHRDVKPANVLLAEDVAKLSDFGIARLVGQSQVTAAQSIIGTLAYTPPEIFHNSDFDGRGDIYQLGITMYEMLLGRAPFTSAAADNKAMIIRRIIDKPAPPLAPFDIPQPISDLIDELLAKDPADRPQSASVLGRRLNDIERSLGRASTPMYQEPALDPTIDNDATMAIDMDAELNPTIDSAPAEQHSEWPAAAAGLAAAGTAGAAGAAGAATNAADGADPKTPTPPVIQPPDDVNITIAEPRPHEATSILAKPTPAPDPAPKPTAAATSSRPAAQSIPTKASTSQRPPAEPERAKRSKAPWMLFLLAFIIVAGAGAIYALTNTADGGADLTEDTGEEGATDTNADQTPEREPEFSPIDTDVFAEPSGGTGIVFSSVANSQGLTIVGSAGTGEGVEDQRSIIWTFGANGFAVQRDFAETGPHRMWSIGVIDGETFLAVGDAPGRDGIAWTGTQASAFTEAPNSDFTGAANDILRAVAEDTSQVSTFLVGGSRTEGGTAVPGLWEVAGEPSWTEPTWTQVDLGSTNPGVITDIAVDGDRAIAVGHETVDGTELGTVRIRRGDQWSDLIAAQPNTRFWSVAISGDQIIVVGEQNVDTTPTPVAVISDPTGIGLIHVLPLRTNDGAESGLARRVAVLADGTVIAVGDAARRTDPNDASSALDRDGTIWQFLPEENVWTTRASPDLIADGFTELWAIDEFDGTTYVFGRTESEDGLRPAAGWVLDLN